MFNFAVSRESLLSGFQWFFFIFCNTVVVPPTLLSAFQLPQSSLLTLTQYAFLATALACFAQAFCGHRRAIMEGPGGLWWGTILTITLGEASRGTPINDIATSLAVGIALSGVLTMLIGFSGLGHRLARLFTPSVMVLFMLMLGAQLTTIFFKGMLGLPFGIADPNFKIQLPPFALSVAVMCLVLAMIIFLPQRFARYGLLVGTITGWLLWYFCFPSSHSLSGELHWQWFPLGSGGALSPGIIAPVSGGEIGAREGTLSIMVGGDEAVFERVKPLFELLGKNITLVGGNGDGQTCKVANQIIVALNIEAVSEALLFASKAGADPVRVRQALMGGFASSRILEVHGERMIKRTFNPGFKIALHQKDLNLALQSAKALALNLPNTATCQELFNTCAANGGSQLDHSALVQALELMANHKLA